MGNEPLSSEFLAHCIRRSGALIRAVLQSVIRARLEERFGNRANEVLWESIRRASESAYDSAATCGIFLKEHENDPLFSYKMDYTVCNAVLRDEQLGLLRSDEEENAVSQAGRVRGDQAHEGDILTDPDELSREHWEKNRRRVRALGEQFREYLDPEIYGNLVEYYNGRGGKFVPSKARPQARAGAAEEDDGQDQWQDQWEDQWSPAGPGNGGDPGGGPAPGHFVIHGGVHVPDYRRTEYTVPGYVPPRPVTPPKPVETPAQREARLRRQARVRKILLRSFLAVLVLAVLAVTAGPPLIYGYALGKLGEGKLISAYAALDRISMLHPDLEEKRVEVLNLIREDLLEDGFRQEVIDAALEMPDHPSGFLMKYDSLGEFTAVPSDAVLVYRPAGEGGFYTLLDGNPVALTLPEGAEPIWAMGGVSDKLELWLLCGDGTLLHGLREWNFSAHKYAEPSWYEEQYRLIAAEGLTMEPAASLPGARRILEDGSLLWMEDGRVLQMESGGWLEPGARLTPEDGVLLYEDVIGFLDGDPGRPVTSRGFAAKDLVHDENRIEGEIYERAGSVTVTTDGRCCGSISGKANDGNDTLFADILWDGYPTMVYDLEDE